jgi:hypothetical protein
MDFRWIVTVQLINDKIIKRGKPRSGMTMKGDHQILKTS